MAANVVQRLQTIVSRERSPFEQAVVTVGYVRAGAKDNIIPDEAELGISVRTFDEAVRTATLASITRIINAESLASGAERQPEIVPRQSFPLTTVDATVMRQVADRFRTHFGADRVTEIDQPAAASEDVGIYGSTLGIPTAFWLWGGSDPEVVRQAEETAKPVPANHSPLFAPVLEPTLTTGVEALTAAALELLATAER
jgi:hippurate hydrolase